MNKIQKLFDATRVIMLSRLAHDNEVKPDNDPKASIHSDDDHITVKCIKYDDGITGPTIDLTPDEAIDLANEILEKAKGIKYRQSLSVPEFIMLSSGGGFLVNGLTGVIISLVGMYVVFAFLHITPFEKGFNFRMKFKIPFSGLLKDFK